MREISWREALTPLLAVLGLTFLLQDVVLSETLRKRILGPALGAAVAEVSAAMCLLAALAVVVLLWTFGWQQRKGSEKAGSEATVRLWPLALLNLLVLVDPSEVFDYAHLYLGLGALGFTGWGMTGRRREEKQGDKETATEGSPDERGQGDEGAREDLQIDQHPASHHGISGGTLRAQHSQRDSVIAHHALRDIPPLIYAAIGLYVIVFVTMALLQYHSMNLQPVDCYSAEQRMWNALHGILLKSDNTPRSFLAEHVQVFDLVLLPIYALWPGMEILFILHIVAAATCALPVWLYAAEVLGNRRAASGFALAFLLHPGLHYSNLEISGAAYNPVFYCVPFLLWGLIFLQREQYRSWAICSVLAITVKEEIALLIFMQGLYLALVKGRQERKARIVGAVSAVASFVWFALCVWVIIPHFAGGESHVLSHYTEIGETSGDILREIARRPWLVPMRMFTAQNMEFLALLFLSYGWLGLLDPLTLFFALPTYVYLMLANTTYFPPHSISYYYHIPLIPFAVVGSIRGLAWLARMGEEDKETATEGSPDGRGQGDDPASSIRSRITHHVSRFTFHAPIENSSTYLLAMSIGAMVFLSKTPLSLLFYDSTQPMMYYRSVYVVPERAKVVKEMQALIPRDKTVAASEYLALFFTHWKHCYINLPAHAAPVDYMVFDVEDKWRRLYSPDQPPPHKSYLASGEFEKVFEKEGFVVLKRIVMRNP